ncbi:MAG: primosomal protein N' [Puniceicoccales bacterium]|jgi:primosomal protein N' (replication factor Y)|nr:primosomal protein N' [Puniceicoccales bacterium]
MECLCAEVLTFGTFDRPLLYRVPLELVNVLRDGMLIRVSVGKLQTFAIVLRIYSADVEKLQFQIKEIISIEYGIPLIGRDLIDLIFWMRKYYFAPHRALLEAVIPATIRKNVSPKLISKISLLKTLDDGECKALKSGSPKQWEIYEFLLNSGEIFTKAELRKFSQSALSALVEKGVVGERFEKEDRFVCCDFSDGTRPGNTAKITLSWEQCAAVDAIGRSLAGGKFKVHLLHGVTGSGKTEVYLDAIRRAVGIGGDVIYLVPELALTPQTVNRIRHGLNLSDSEVVVWHSGLSEGERRNTWLAMANGDAKVVIGARSAVFAPLKNVKIITVDEEHETTYKQCEVPRYHARDAAVYRAKLCDAVCILGSATPSVESLFNSASGKYELNVLTKRIDGSSLPRMEIVDMRYERNSRGKKIISQRLMNLMEERLNAGEQTILFLNRRGYASVIFCNNCDYVATCPNCSTALTYHKPQNLLRCHTCGYIEQLPSKCQKCGGGDILQGGVGTQRLADIVRAMFPKARVERLDSDTTATKDSFCKVLHGFGNGKIDILIGTQMISKGLDFPNVSLVGIVNIDNAMNFSDFRANERVFQSIIQVAGRAGRGSKPGVVIIQTHCPNCELLRLAIENDHENFLKNELTSRSEFFYPPFSHILRVIFSGKNEEKVGIFSKLFADDLRKRAQNLFDIRGPSPAAIRKTNGRFRFSLACFSRNVIIPLEKISETMNLASKARDVAISVDVDPIDMM